MSPFRTLPAGAVEIPKHNEGLAVLPLHAAEDWLKLLRLVVELDARVRALETAQTPKEATR